MKQVGFVSLLAELSEHTVTELQRRKHLDLCIKNERRETPFQITITLITCYIENNHKNKLRELFLLLLSWYGAKIDSHKSRHELRYINQGNDVYNSLE